VVSTRLLSSTISDVHVHCETLRGSRHDRHSPSEPENPNARVSTPNDYCTIPSFHPPRCYPGGGQAGAASTMGTGMGDGTTTGAGATITRDGAATTGAGNGKPTLIPT
jgi:hypothetical protein